MSTPRLMRCSPGFSGCDRMGPVSRTSRLALAALSGVLLATVALADPSAGAAPQLAPKCPPSTVQQDIKAADAVFRGVVTKVRGVHGSGRHRTRDYRVAADRVYQGSLVTDKVVVTARVRSTGCTVPTLLKGTRYIFFARENGARLMATTATARATHHLTRQVVNLLGDGKQPQPKPPASAEFSTVADATPPSLSRLLAPGAALVIVSLLGLLVVGRLGRRTP
jgi:hypothetical protein